MTEILYYLTIRPLISLRFWLECYRSYLLLITIKTVVDDSVGIPRMKLVESTLSKATH